MARIAVADGRKKIAGVGVKLRGQRAVSPFHVRERPFQQPSDGFGRQRVEFKDERPRGKRRVDEEVWVVRRRADEDDCSVLDIGQQDVLLGLVEAVYLVDEEDCALPAELVPRAVADLADVGDAGNDAGESHEVALGGPGDHFGERRLTAAGRPVEDDVREPVRFDDPAQKLARTEYVVLPDDLVESRRTHPRGKRLC